MPIMRRKADAFAMAPPILSMLGAIIAPCWAEMTAVEADIGKTHVGVERGPLPPLDAHGVSGVRRQLVLSRRRRSVIWIEVAQDWCASIKGLIAAMARIKSAR